MTGRGEMLHSRMVDRLIQSGCIQTPAVEAAFRAVPRAWFLVGRPLEEIYAGESVVIKQRADGLPISSSTEPCLMGAMLDQLRAETGRQVLEIGTATGYNAALLGHLVGPEGRVTTVDLDRDLVEQARRNLEQAGFLSVNVVSRDGWLGVPEHAPFDRIEATVGVWDLSPGWIEQLADDGLLLAPLWLRGGLQVSVAFVKDGTALRSESVRRCGFMRLRGSGAGPEGYLQFGGWSASLDLGSDADATRALLKSAPRSEPTTADERARAGWFARFALEEPGAVSFVRERDKLATVGLLDRAAGSLALLDGDRFLEFGETGALSRLKDYASSARPLRVESLAVSALPLDRPADEGGDWILERPHIRFVIREKTIPSG